MCDNTEASGGNADELVAPEWLNEEFFTKVLSDHEKAPELQVTGLHFSPASAKGDHYASVMFRAKVEYATRQGAVTKSLIIKTMPEQEGHKKDLLGESPIFQTEIGMYTRVLPEFERMLRQAGDESTLHVDCIYHSLKPRQVMIFEDLVEMGYAVVRRWLTQEELSSTYLKLAKIHATSMKILNENPEYFKDFQCGFFDMPNLIDSPLMTGGWEPFIEMLGRTPGLSKYQPHFQKIRHVCLDRLKNVMQEYRNNRQTDGYYVLCHGDFHSRNIMFRNNKETGALEDCMVLDYQGCNVTHISVDLIQSIYMLMGPEQRGEELDNLLNYYFSILVETLTKIGYKGAMPTLTGFWREIKRNKYYDFLVVSTFQPVVMAIRAHSRDAGELMENDEARLACYLLEDYVEEATKILHRFDRLGYFDDL